MQMSQDPAQQMHSLTIRIERSISDHTGSFTIEIGSDDGKILGRDRISWRKPHDLQGLPAVARQVVEHHLWGTPADVILAFRVAFRQHVDSLDIDAQGELRRLGTLTPLKRKGKR
jgi:hypothetical protein